VKSPGRNGNGRMMRVSREEAQALADWRRDTNEIRRLANEVALSLFEREYERAMGTARGAIAEVSSSLQVNGRGRK